MSVMIGIDPHKALHAVCAIDRHESRARRGRGALGSATTRPVAGVGVAVRVADVGDRVRGWARLSARSAAARPRRVGGRCAGDVVVAGAAVGVGALEQERRQRRPRRGRRRVAGTVVGGGARRGSRLGVALVGQSAVRHQPRPQPRLQPSARLGERVGGGRDRQRSRGQPGRTAARHDPPGRTPCNANASSWRTSCWTRSASSTTGARPPGGASPRPSPRRERR